MRFLADESCDFGIVRRLRAAGFDVLAIAEISPRVVDEAVIDLAYREARVLLTEDKDFGQLVYAGTRATAGVILIRFPATARKHAADTVLEVVRRRGDRLIGPFTVGFSGAGSRTSRPSWAC